MDPTQERMSLLRRELVDDARQWWKWGSTYVFAAIVAFPTVWLASPELQALLPPKVVSVIAPVVGVLGFAIRITQRSRHDVCARSGNSMTEKH